MGELLPTLQAERIRASLTDYLSTTFALTDADAREGLDRFLSDPGTGIFKGPYARLRLPFRPADEGWQDLLEWRPAPPEGFVPYGHQAAAFARLASQRGGVPRRPEPTLVVTGTGSGKTEAFLYPILDHVLRARRAGTTGTKALILYPMNALANDQAARLARLLTAHPELAEVTAALYTGEQARKRTRVTADGLINDRDIIRDTAPDILLTNYKMLDQLLLRAEDAALWQQSATSLRYLVLDEFHTYDGGQGTDVAMLLRRLGLALKSYWPQDDPGIPEEDRARPLGLMTPVATSATLGDPGDEHGSGQDDAGAAGAMLDFARDVFGETFGADCVVGESRLSLDEWVGSAPAEVEAVGLSPLPVPTMHLPSVLDELAALGPEPEPGALTGVVLGGLYDVPADTFAGADPALLLAAARAHPLVQDLARDAAAAVAVDDLAVRVFGERSRASAGGAQRPATAYLTAVLAALSHIRAAAGRAALSVDVHLWVRELSRIDRSADTRARFRWGDDGPAVGGELDGVRPCWPAVYCRHCGRSGWGVALAPVGDGLAVNDETIRRNHARREGRFRALVSAPGEADAAFAGDEVPHGLLWFRVADRSLQAELPDEEDPGVRDGELLPVLTTTGREADRDAQDDTCPACGQADGIRFLGSAIATLLSVSLSTLFGAADLDPAEKKALVFTDSVQDAAHRAGFVQARSHTLTLRAALAAAIAEGALTLDQLVEEVIQQAGNDPFARYRILPPELADRESFTAFWTAATRRDVPNAVRTRVRKRLALDAALEFGLNSRTGRTLEVTGAVAAEVQLWPAARIAALARAVLGESWREEQLEDSSAGGEPSDGTLVQWVRGFVERMRAQGAIAHPWFETYQREDGNRWSIWGGRPRGEGMPAFPRDRPAPAYPRVGGSRAAASASAANLDAVTSPQAWYAVWTSRVLSTSPLAGGRLARLLIERLAREGLLTTTPSASGAVVYALPPSAVVVTPAADSSIDRPALTCDTCGVLTPGSATVVEQLAGAPCFVLRCRGTLTRSLLSDNFYRRLYGSRDMRRIVAREHTGLLDDETRLAYEDGFKAAGASPQAPNVLVATPTLEMGIDIGDLSAVLLASLPRTVASYVQRVGRAGRLTGNALSLAYVKGRGEQLPKLGDPLSVLNGEVRPPATYLQAEEILRRQFTAFLADGFARDPRAPHPRRVRTAIGSLEPGSFLGELILAGESGITGDSAGSALSEFLGTFADLPSAVADVLAAWLAPVDGPGTSAYAQHLAAASARWQQAVTTLDARLTAVTAAMPDLEARAASPARTEDDERALRSARAGLRLLGKQLADLRGEYWIAVLEEYGVLPNYTLLDDRVSLDVGLSWIDPDTAEYRDDAMSIQRGSVHAIREFAPGATFYARGLEIAIDAVDLGLDGEGVRSRAFCPACGYSADLASQPAAVAACPRCGSRGIADAGQRLDVVELTHVTAEVRRDEASISDRRDERDTTYFTVVTTADIDPDGTAGRWYVEDVAFGWAYLRSVTLRWVNVGPAASGTTLTLAGNEVAARRFRVCSGCGKLDTEAGRNSPHEHRTWCRYRTAAEEHTVSVALMRTLRTQGVLLRLPTSVTLGDDFAVPSLAAALLLGLREQMGGHPDHLRVEQVIDPTHSDGTQNHEALLLHDIVPGGTGYLADMARPDRLRELLVLAWQRVRTCECRHEERLACHRCLLPFTPFPLLGRVSRSAAERHLRTLLDLPPETETTPVQGWRITGTPPEEDPESHLEQWFRKLLVQRLQALGASVRETPGASGNSVRINVPGSRRSWTLSPQASLGSSRPDFVLASNDTTVPLVAVFTDGRAFHASETCNRLADDAEKRELLRAEGKVVLAVTAQDLARSERNSTVPPSWFSARTVGQLLGTKPFSARPAAYEALRLGPLEWLLDWIVDPSAEDTRTVARAVPMFLSAGASRLSVTADTSLADVGRAVLSGDPASTGSRDVAIWRLGSLVAVVEPRGPVLDVALVLDDRPGALDSASSDAWHEWLRLSNALALREWPTTVTTVTRVLASPQTSPASRFEPVATAAGLPEKWVGTWDAAFGEKERALIVELAERPELDVPQVGAEGPMGIPMDLSWPQSRAAVALEGFSDQDRADLERAGWTVLPPDADAIAAALRGDVK